MLIATNPAIPMIAEARNVLVLILEAALEADLLIGTRGNRTSEMDDWTRQDIGQIDLQCHPSLRESHCKIRE